MVNTFAAFLKKINKVKREGNYPTNAINYCLSEEILPQKMLSISIFLQCLIICFGEIFMAMGYKYHKKNFPNAKIEFVSHHIAMLVLLFLHQTLMIVVL